MWILTKRSFFPPKNACTKNSLPSRHRTLPENETEQRDKEQTNILMSFKHLDHAMPKIQPLRYFNYMSYQSF